MGYLIIYRNGAQLSFAADQRSKLDERPLGLLNHRSTSCRIRMITQSNGSLLNSEATNELDCPTIHPWRNLESSPHHEEAHSEELNTAAESDRATAKVDVEPTLRADEGFPLFGTAKSQQQYGQALKLKASYQARDSETWCRPSNVRGRRCPPAK